MQKHSEDKIERLAYSVNEMAEAIGVSSRTVWDYIKNGSIKYFRLGTRVLIPKQNLEEFIEKRTQDAVHRQVGKEGRNEQRQDPARRSVSSD